MDISVSKGDTREKGRLLSKKRSTIFRQTSPKIENLFVEAKEKFIERKTLLNGSILEDASVKNPSRPKKKISVFASDCFNDTQVDPYIFFMFVRP